MSRREQWRAAPGFPDYEVSSHGRVRRATPGKNTWPGRIVAPAAHQGGYLLFRLAPARGAKKQTVIAHKLVAEAFIGQRPDGMLILHKDDDKQNNHYKNLRYGTGIDNASDARRNGTLPKGERHGNCRYSDELVAAAIADARTTSIAESAKKHGLKYLYVYKVVNGMRRAV